MGKCLTLPSFVSEVSVGCPSIMQDVPTTPPAVEASAVSTLAPTSSLVVVV